MQEYQPENNTNRATASSILDHYIQLPFNVPFDNVTLLHFAQNYSMPKELGTAPTLHHKLMVAIISPYCSNDPHGPKYKQY